MEMLADITVAELHAIHLAMTQASVHSLRKLMVITDSMQSLKMFQQLPSFIANGFADVKKSYIDILTRIQILKDGFDDVKMVHVHSHQTVKSLAMMLNSGADSMATAARDRAINKLKLTYN